jgi:hypothetical protein
VPLFFNKVEEVKCATVGRKIDCGMGWCDCIFAFIGALNQRPMDAHKRELPVAVGALLEKQGPEL